MRWVGRVLALLLVTAAAARAAAPTNDDCLGCHGDSGTTRQDGRALAPDLPRFADSVHGQAGLSCVDCHADLSSATEFPHAEKLEPAQCASCHESPVAEHAKGIHARPGGPACAACHGAHEILPAKDPASATHHLNVARTCAKCHADVARLGGKAGVPAAFADSIHGQALSRRGLVVAPNCATCHGSHAIQPPEDPRSRVAHGNVPATCGKCHEGILREYHTSVHAAAVREGRRGAVCSDCHTAHGITATVPAWRLEVVRECGTCHEESIRTYRDGFHGQASALGYTRVATCADCHGSHGIRKEEDPASRVSAANREKTCARCHTGASARFATFDPHANPDDVGRSKPVHYTAKFMKTLLVGVFLFFALHTALWFPRSWQERGKAGRGGKA